MAKGSKDDPWVLQTPPGTSEYTMYRDEDSEPAIADAASTTNTFF